MNPQIKELRTYQLAALAILRCWTNCNIEQVTDSYYDFIVTFKDTGLKFGVEVKNSGFLRTNHYRRYIESLVQHNVLSTKKIPILLAAVNEEEESVQIGFLLAWQWGKPKLYIKPSMMELNRANADKILDRIKSMDETIRFLSLHGMYVVKKISIEYCDEDGYLSRGTVVYLRNFTENYKMQTKEILDERERFFRNVNGVPQDEYPDDVLDKTILNIIQDKFPDARKISDLLLFSTELRDLQLLSRSVSRTIQLEISPKLEPEAYIYEPLQVMLNPIRFSVDVFADFFKDAAVFENLHLQGMIPIADWFRVQQECIKALSTIESPKNFFLGQ